MFVVDSKAGEEFVIDERPIKVKVLRVAGDSVRLGIAGRGDLAQDRNLAKGREFDGVPFGPGPIREILERWM